MDKTVERTGSLKKVTDSITRVGSGGSTEAERHIEEDH